MNSKAERYRWIQHTLVRFRYVELSKAEKGVPPVPRGQSPRSLAERVTVPVGYIFGSFL